MKDSKQTELVVCSAIIKPARALIFYKLRTWLDQVVRIVVHTFAAEESKIPIDPESPEGYWYCAGDFCNIDEAGVYQHLIPIKIDFAKCLVSPNIKDDHPNREELVISGEYGIHYVCHNITNRVLYATGGCKTLIDLDIKTTGYEVVVKSVLGVYGQNKVEWERRKSECIDGINACNDDSESVDINNMRDRTRDDEIYRIHLRAMGGNAEKAQNLTDVLNSVDEQYYSISESLVSQFEQGTINESVFHIKMSNACAELFGETIKTVGRNTTQKIYPDCNIDVEIKLEPTVIEKKSFVASS